MSAVTGHRDPNPPRTALDDATDLGEYALIAAAVLFLGCALAGLLVWIDANALGLVAVLTALGLAWTAVLRAADRRTYTTLPPTDQDGNDQP